MGGQKNQFYCFTINNPTQKELTFSEKEVRYAIWQLELGESRKTPHLQGYIELFKQASFKRLKNILGNEAHIEVRRGTRDEARDYCRKTVSRVEGPWEYGNWISGSGHRSDLAELERLLKSGVTEQELSVEHFELWARNFKSIERWNILNASPRTTRTRFIVVLGDPGTGKSRWANENYPNAYWKPSGKWFDGLKPDDDIIIDEFDKSQTTLCNLLSIADRFPLKLPVKGGFVNYKGANLIAISNFGIESWFSELKDVELQAIIRRVDRKITMKWVEDGNIRKVTTTDEVFQVDLETTCLPGDETEESGIKLSEEVASTPRGATSEDNLRSEIEVLSPKKPRRKTTISKNKINKKNQ